MNANTFSSLESERLLLRCFAERDLEPFLAYVNDPFIARYQSWQSYSEQQAREVIERQMHLTPGLPGQWFTFALELKLTRALIGHIALKTQEDTLQAEIGFTLSREYHGKGLAFEAASRVLDYVFMNLEMHRVTAIADCENHRSVTLLDRLGMRREGHFIQNVWFKGKWGDEYLYAIFETNGGTSATCNNPANSMCQNSGPEVVRRRGQATFLTMRLPPLCTSPILTGFQSENTDEPRISSWSGRVACPGCFH